jgi:hypothetical protein
VATNPAFWPSFPHCYLKRQSSKTIIYLLQFPSSKHLLVLPLHLLFWAAIKKKKKKSYGLLKVTIKFYFLQKAVRLHQQPE